MRMLCSRLATLMGAILQSRAIALANSLVDVSPAMRAHPATMAATSVPNSRSSSVISTPFEVLRGESDAETASCKMVEASITISS